MNAVDWKPSLPVFTINSTCRVCTCCFFCSKYACMAFSEALSRNFKLKSKDTASLSSPKQGWALAARHRTDQSPSCLAVQRGEAGLLHRYEQREPQQQGRDGSHSYPSLPSQCQSLCCHLFRINIPETLKHQWQAQCLSKETLPPCREIHICLIYSSLI